MTDPTTAQPSVTPPGGAAQQSRLRGCLANGLLLVLSTAAALGLGEFVFRTFMLEDWVPRTEAQFQQAIAATWPTPVPPAKPPGTLRIISLCDSFGEAGEHRNYCFLIEEALRRQGYQVEVVNLSRGQNDLPDEAEMLRRWGARYQPDLILHGFFVGNDFYAPEDGPLLRYGGINLRHRSFWRHPSPRSLLLLVWLRRYMMAAQATQAAQAERPANLPQEAGGTFSNEEFLRIEHDRLAHCLRAPPPEQRWGAVTGRLDEIKGLAEGMGARYVMLMHPDEVQVEPALLDEVRQAYAVDMAGLDLELPQRFLADWCRSRHVTHIDLLPAFRREGAGGGLYRLRDTHYAAGGNALAARVATPVLLREIAHLPQGGRHERTAVGATDGARRDPHPAGRSDARRD